MRRLLSTLACFLALGCLNVLHDVETPGGRPAAQPLLLDGSPPGRRARLHAWSTFTFLSGANRLFTFSTP